MLKQNTWITLNSAPTGQDGKPYKDGGCITLAGNIIYAQKGSGKHNYFSAYDIAGASWAKKEIIPLKHTALGDVKNKVKDGAAIPSDGNIIYIIKGGGKQDFWKYVPGTPGNWIPLDIIPKLKKVFPRAVLRLLILMDMFIC